MQEIIPVGVMVDNPEKSLHFYRQTMKIGRVQIISRNASGEFPGSLLRLESPQIEINSTQTRIRDRQSSNFQQTFQRLKFWCRDLEELKDRLKQQKLPVFENAGKLSFLDPNGINWDICSLPA